MKRLLIFLALVAPVTLAFMCSAAAQVPPVVSPTPAGEPDVVPDEGEVNQTFFRRFLSVRNQSPERITAFLQFRGFNPQTRKWEWAPALPTAGQALAFEVEPGMEKVLETVDSKVASSTVRIWATSDNLQWDNARNADFFIVPLAATGRREYQAATVETFTYVFAGPQNPDPNIQEPPLPPNTVVEFGQPLGTVVADPGDPGNPAVVANGSPIAQCVTVPLTLTEPVLIPGPLAPPTIPIIREADLAALSLDVRGNGSFSGTIRNNGPSTYSGGREWFVLASFNGQPFTTVLRGPLSGLRPGMSLFISGSAPLVGRAGRYFLRLTPGDLDEANDSVGITVMPPPQADLTVSNLLVANGTASVDVRNNGPSEYSGLFRRCSISDAGGVLTAGPIGKVVPPMAAGQQVTLQFPVNNIDPGPGNVLNARLNAGDQEPGNDFASSPLLSTGVASVTRDFAAGQPFVVGRQLQAQITSDNGQLFGSKLFTLSFQTVGKFPRSSSVTGTITATSGAPQTLQIALPFDPTKTSFVGTLTLTRDANNSNNFANKNFNAVAGTSIADLDIVSVATAGQTASVRIRNNGPDAYNGNRFVTISDSAGNSVASAPVRTGPVAAGQLIVVPVTLNAGVNSGKFHAGFAQTTPDQTIDNNSSNDHRSFVMGGAKPTPIGIILAGSVIVPNVVGMTPAAATAALSGAGLKVTMTGGASTTAVAQNPKAGATVNAGASVNANFGAASVPAIAGGVPPAAPVPPGSVVVPNVVGMTHQAATAALSGAGLRVVMTGSASTTAVAQNPIAGATVSARALVRVNFGAASVAAIAGVVVVPNVIGMTHQAATAALSGAGLNVQLVGGASTTAVSQIPKAGATVNARDYVNVNFGAATVPATPAAPAGSVVVPNVVGLTQAQAMAALSGAGLKVTMTGGASATAVAQNPTAGATVSAGASVNVNFGAASVPANPATPAAPASVVVPNVVGLTQQAATAALTGAGLKTTMTGGASTTAVAQSPKAGATVPQGASVNVNFGAASVPANAGTVVVPNVIGLTQQAADAAITAARLELKAATINSDPKQVATSQNPAAGTKAKPGDDVVVNFRPPAPTPAKAGLSVSNLQITGNGMIAFTLTNNSPVAAGADTYQINATGTTNQLGPIQTPAVPANGSIAVTQQDMTDKTGVMGVNWASTVTVKLGSGSTISAPFTFNAKKPKTPPAGTAPAAPPNVPATVTVPNVIGMTQQAADAAITAARLELKAATINSDPRQVATSQNPAAGTKVKPDDDVYVNFRPPAPAAVRVPNLFGMTQAAATTALTGAGLKITITGDPKISTALSQVPAAGASVKAGDTVTVNFANIAVGGPVAPPAPAPVNKYDLALGKATLTGSTFSVPVTNSGPAFTSDPGDTYTIVGPGGFTESGKIPNLAANGTRAIAHTARSKLATGTFTITLNLKDFNPANNTATVSFVAAASAAPAAPANTNDLAIGRVTLTGSTFSIPVTNSGPTFMPYPEFTYTIVGPGGFSEGGQIPQIAAKGTGAITHTAKSRLGAGAFTITLNVKDFIPGNNTTTVNNASVPPAPAAKSGPGGTAPPSPPAAPAAVRVPSVVGMTQPAATSALGGVRLTMKITGDPRQGNATSQNPAAGTAANPGQVVTVNYPPTPLAPAPKAPTPPPPAPAANVTVPNVVGLKLTNAQSQLRGAGLAVSTTGNNSGAVVTQNPTAGSQVAKNSTVTLTLR